MNIFLITEYVKRLTKEDITKFALSQGISLTEEELEIMWLQIMNNLKLEDNYIDDSV